MPISSGPIGLTRSYLTSGIDGTRVTWNQPGLHTHAQISSVGTLERARGSGVSREVDVLFGHAQLIPTFTLQPAEEYRLPANQYLDPACSPAPRAVDSSSQRRRASTGGPHVRLEGDTTSRLGLATKDTRWDGRVIHPSEQTQPMGGAFEVKRGRPSTARSRSRSPTGRNKPSSKAPQFLSSSLHSPEAQRSIRARTAAIEPDPQAARDVERGTFRSPHKVDLDRARKYVRALDEELEANARAAVTAEQKARQASLNAERERERERAPRKQREWDRDMLIGVHVRSVDLERKWHDPLDRIGALYDRTRDMNATTSTSILQESLAQSMRAEADPPEAASGLDGSQLMSRSTALHTPRSKATRESESMQDPMADTAIDVGFFASGKRHHEEALGGKTLLKTRAWPRDPLSDSTGRRTQVSGAATSAGRSMEGAHGLNTSTTSARIRAQESGDLPNQLNASFGRAHHALTAAASASRHSDSRFQLADAVDISNTMTSTPTSASKKKEHHSFQLHSSIARSPASVSQKQLRPASARTLNSSAVGQQPSASFHTNPLNTSQSALLNNSVTAASAAAQAAHAAKFDETGSLRAHPRGYADEFLRTHGISVASGLGGLNETSHDASLNPNNTTSAAMVSPTRVRDGIEGNGAILDLAPALKAREKTPWRHTGASSTRRHDRKMKTAEDIALREAKRNRLPSSRARSTSASQRHREGHTSEGGSGFLINDTALKSSLHLTSGRHILGRTRETKRIDLTDDDWAHVKRAEKSQRARAYSASRRGPSEPRPHHTSVIEEAMALEKATRRERELVAREREWRQQQIWLSQKKKGMDALEAKKAAATRKMPARPRSAIAARQKAIEKKSAQRANERPSLIVPTAFTSMDRIAHDIDLDSEVRGKESLHRKQELVARMHRADADNTSVDWSNSRSDHHLTDATLIAGGNPLEESAYRENDSNAGSEPEADESDIASSIHRDRRALEDGEAEEFAQRWSTEEMAHVQENRQKAATRSGAIADALRDAEAARKQMGAKNDDRQECAPVQSTHPLLPSSAFRRSTDIRIGASPTTLSFTASTRSAHSDASASMPASAGGRVGNGAESLLIAQSYDRRVKELVAYLRRRQPFMQEEERLHRAQTKARELVTQELARMDPPPAVRHSHEIDLFADYVPESDLEVTRHRESDRWESELDEMRQAQQEMNKRYHRMRQQATEALRL